MEESKDFEVSCESIRYWPTMWTPHDARVIS
jgi:hypothetical protein